MINTTRPWALSSPSRSSFQSRSSARSSPPSVAGISLLSRLGPPPRLSTRGIVVFLIAPSLSPSPLVRPRRRFHERALAVCLKIRLLSPARNAINLIPFRSRLLARVGGGFRPKGMSNVAGRSVADLMKYDFWCVPRRGCAREGNTGGMEEGAKRASHPEILANTRFHYHGTFTDRLFTAIKRTD